VVREDGGVVVGVSPPSGTVTFLFTDVVGSTRLWEERTAGMERALAVHDGLLRDLIETHGGYVFSLAGDSFAAAFGRVSQAVEAAITAQSALADADWPDGARIAVRMGLHVGEAQERDGNYFGPAVNRAARVMSAAHGGQVLVTSSVAGLVESAELVDLGDHRLKDLSSAERLFQLGGGDFGPVRSLNVVRHNLPVQRTQLLGREDEIDHVEALVRSDRLVTLTGIGGAGKTRLALSAAAELADRFADGVFFVDLSPLADSDLVAVAVAEALGIPIESASGDFASTARLGSKVSDQQMLIVLDNCEHVIDAAADLVDELLEAGDAVRVLATSREALEVEGERTFRVPSLEVGSAEVVGPAFSLLVERAQAAVDGFGVNNDNKAALLEVCERVDGIPLAIELAAAQLTHLSPAELLQQLDDRFRMLVGGRGRRRQRQHTLQAMMDWSWDLLDADERAVLAELSVFSGGCTLTAASAVCKPARRMVDEVLRSLVAKSLVVAGQNRWGSRYRLLETVRLYGQLKLADSGDAAIVRRRHADWFASWANSWPFEEQWASSRLASQLRADIDNLRSAVDWLIDDGDHEALAHIVQSCNFLWRHSFSVGEALEWTDAVDLAALDASNRARVLLARADAEYVNNDYPGMRARALEAYEAAVAASDDAVAAAALTVSSQGLSIEQPEVALERLQEAATRAHRASASRVEAVALALQGFTGRRIGWDPAACRDLAERAAELCSDDGWDRASSLTELARARAEQGQPQAAIDLYRSLAVEADEYGLALQAARAWLSVAWAAAVAADREAWFEGVRAAYRRYREARTSRGLTDTLLAFALWEAHNGDPATAAELLATVRTEELGDMGGYDFYHLCRTRVQASGLTADQIHAARASGRATTVARSLELQTTALVEQSSETTP